MVSAPVPDKNSHVLILDNYDSFTWNLYQLACRLSARVTVIRTQDISLEALVAESSSQPLPYTHLIISPGPGHPDSDSGISIPAIHHFAGRIPIFGVCLGLQCIFTAFGGTVDVAGEIVHGKTSEIFHDAKGIFWGIEKQGFNATRYHSLVGKLGTLPDVLEVTSKTHNGLVMGVRHKKWVIDSVQYHPESILSEEGETMMRNFLRFKGGLWEENPGFGITMVEQTSGKLPTPMPAQVPSILQKIYAQRKQDVEKAKNTPGFFPSDLDSLINLHVAPPAIDFYSRLLPTTAKPVSLLAEIKRASPSKGSFLEPGMKPPSSAEIAQSYANAGAAAISVLTEPTWFKGALNDMLAARQIVGTMPNRPAILRKDFIFDKYQIDEARVSGADSVLLIVAMLQQEELKALYDHSKSRGMEPLVEVNNEEELERALQIGAKVIGVNNRNLNNFQVDMDTTKRIMAEVKKHFSSQTANGTAASSTPPLILALSGISSRADVQEYEREGISGILVGESLMRASDRKTFVHQLLGTTNTVVKPAGTLVKICGVKNVATALLCKDAGADFIGLNFVPSSRRKISLSQAKEIVDALRKTGGRMAAPMTRTDSRIGTKELGKKDWFEYSTFALMNKSVSEKPQVVGVFQNQPLEFVLEAIALLDLDVVQLHGHEPAEWAQVIPRPVIRAFHVSNPPTPQVLEATRPGYHAVPLFDTQLPASSLSGGAGKTFDHQLANQIAGDVKFILAGGLTANNVAEAVRRTRPWAVDVAGGVESDGEKTEELIRAFVTSVREASASN
ncbi:IGPS-domain-containing protein [Atractiella rhizophila]|nr:IGPS-domain-containing protein [Atractiella rhizophila]